MFWNKKPNYMQALSELLANSDNRESFLGVKAVSLPNPKDIHDASARLAHYSESSDYLTFVEEVWARILNHLDIILDDKTTDARVQYHRGALKAELDLLRVSYQARDVVMQADRSNETLPR
jgi:hypothetical protein